MRKQEIGLGQQRTEPREGVMPKPPIAAAARDAAAGPHQCDLPLDPASLNERLFEISLWLAKREIPHRIRIAMEPEQGRVRVSFVDTGTAKAFRDRFGQCPV